jgi:Ferredoxin-dependent bilin reductase
VNFKNLIGRIIFGELPTELSQLGLAVEQRLVEALGATPMEKYANLLDLKNTRGESTGYVRTYQAPRMEKLACLSIDIMPGMRYFNIHAIPDHHYEVPRFNFEGMVTTKTSLLSMDLYPDMDVIMNFDYINNHYAGVAKIYEKAKKHKKLRPEPSRLPHLRALCSPYFLLAKNVEAEDIFTMQDWALAYLDEWLKIYQAQGELDSAGAEHRLERRLHVARTIIDNDPDRDKVVSTYGEHTTRMIEAAAML